LKTKFIERKKHRERKSFVNVKRETRERESERNKERKKKKRKIKGRAFKILYIH